MLSTSKLPEELNKIDVVFKKNEKLMHSMVFYGKTTLYIGIKEKKQVEETNKDPDFMFLNLICNENVDTKGRVETFELSADEELFGCEIHHNDLTAFGVTWLKRNKPKI